MNKTTLDMSAIMASYTKRVHADYIAAQAVRNGAPKPLPTERWNISDRH